MHIHRHNDASAYVRYRVVFGSFAHAVSLGPFTSSGFRGASANSKCGLGLPAVPVLNQRFLRV